MFYIPPTYAIKPISSEYLLRQSGKFLCHTNLVSFRTGEPEYFFHVRFKMNKTIFNFYDVRNRESPTHLYEGVRRFGKHHMQILIKDPVVVEQIKHKLDAELKANLVVFGTGSHSIELPKRGATAVKSTRARASTKAAAAAATPATSGRSKNLYEERSIHAWVPSEL